MGSTEIKPGWGVAQFYIGMPIDSFDGELVETQNDRPVVIDGLLKRSKDGILASHEDGRITTIDFRYLGDGFTSFPRGTSDGITAQSTYNDIRRIYGEPSYVLRSRRSNFGEFPRAEELFIDYVERGIGFTMLDRKLAWITVREPREDFDYEKFGRVMKEYLDFIRPHD